MSKMMIKWHLNIVNYKKSFKLLIKWLILHIKPKEKEKPILIYLIIYLVETIKKDYSVDCFKWIKQTDQW